MDFSEEQKQRFMNEVVDVLLRGLESEELSTDDAADIADITLQRIEKVTSSTEVVRLLEELAARWPMFSDLAKIRAGEVKEAGEATVTANVLALTQQGKIDEALQLAKSATQTP